MKHDPKRTSFRLVPTHYKCGINHSIEPTCAPGEFISKVELNEYNWLGQLIGLRASFTRYHEGEQWFLGHAAWHQGAPVTAALYAGEQVDPCDLTKMKDAVVMAIRAYTTEVEERGAYGAYERARINICADKGVAA